MTRDLGEVLLTGGTGFIGGNVAQALAREGAAVFAPTRKDWDLNRSRTPINAAGHSGFDTVFHFASRGVRSKANDATLISEEMALAKTVLQVLKPGGFLFYAGSVSEYGTPGRKSEFETCSPQNAYARAKFETGLFLREASEAYGFTVCVGRIFGAYGPGEGEKRLFPAIVSAVKAGHPIDLSDGLQVRDFIHVGDVARATLKLAELSNPPECVNIGTGVGYKVRDIVETLVDQIHAPRELIRFGARERSPHDLDNLVADVQRLKAALGWVPPQRLLSGRILDLLVTQIIDA